MESWEKMAAAGAKMSTDRELERKIRAIQGMEKTFNDAGTQLTLGYGVNMETVRVWDKDGNLLRVVPIAGDSPVAIIHDLACQIADLLV